MNTLKEFYNNHLCRKSFFLPLVFFVIVAYSFPIYNKTLYIDDLNRDYFVGSGNIGLSGRWGAVLWVKLMGIVDFSPFIDRFLTIVFLMCAALLFCYLLYSIDKNKNTLSYTISASIFVTYPLFNEIWIFAVSGTLAAIGLSLATMAVIVERSSLPKWKRILYASAFLLLPMSSYEVGVFYYITLVAIIIFYEFITGVWGDMNYGRWFKINVNYIIPVIAAFVCRFLISFVINSIYNLDYNSGGATNIAWLHGEFLPVLKGCIVSNFYYYVVSGLVYFPLTFFVVLLVFFCSFVTFRKDNKLKSVFLALIVILSLFLLAIIQGDPMPHRHASSITLFASFVVYLICISIKSSLRKYAYVFLFGLCWYQAVYINKLLGLDNLRSDNELSVIRQLGMRLTSEYEKKPLVVVSEHNAGEWINSQVTVDDSTWNGRLFYDICNKLGVEMERPFMFTRRPNSVILDAVPIQELFRYCGFDIKVISYHFTRRGEPNSNFSSFQLEKERKVLSEAIKISKNQNLKPYQLYDNGNYIILHLGGKYYECN